MKTLLQKELRLALHPTAPLFLCLSAMLLIPNYPYCVVFFYTSLAVFFICLTGGKITTCSTPAFFPSERPTW